MTAQLRTAPPEPQHPRWQPLRCGLVELFHHDAEEFWFRDGRLLLRGNNGTGKSKVLALTLPFLLDGDHRPNRVEPDGDPHKRMEWNLLLGGRHSDRIGYVWLELGRRDDHGAAHHLTLGCGLKAVTGKGVVGKWFFVTEQRIGADLQLVDANRLVLSRERLRDALGDAGQLIDGVEAYRRAVDERLFGLGAERYAALVNLLIQLRQPQLSKRPDEQALSRALTAALPPIDESVITHVADALRALEQDREQLAELTEARAAVGGFAERYRTYAAVATKRRESAVRRATSAYEETGRRLSRLEGRLGEARAEEARLRAERQAQHERLAGLRATERTLRSSPEMRDAARLEQAAERVERAEAAARNTAAELEAAETAARDRRRAATEAEAALAQTREEADAAAGAAADAAAAAGVRSGHKEVVAPSVAALLDGTAGADALPERAAEAVATRRAEGVVLVRRLAEAAAEAERAEVAAATARDDAASERDAAADAVAVAEDDYARAAAAHLQAVETYAAGLQILALPDLAGTLAALEGWVADLDGPHPAAAAVERAARAAAQRLAAEEARVEARQAALDEQAAALREERDRIAAGEHPVPPAPRTRDGRDGRPGAPLWQLVEFADHLEAGERAGVEAALEAAGLLDAWVTPDGGLLEGDTHDAAVTVGAPVESSLAAVLRPADEAPVAPAVVARLLEGIGLGPATADSWIDASGRFRLGVAEGRWGKAEAEFIGYAAREAARRRRLAELESDLATLAGEQAGLQTQREDLTARAAALDAEVAALPADAEVRRTAATAANRREELARSSERLATAERRLAERREAAQTAVGERDTAAASLDLPVDRAALDEVAEAVAGYRLALVTLWGRLRAFGVAAGHAAAAATALTEAKETVERHDAHMQAARRELASAQGEHATLDELVGAAVADVLTRLEATVADIGAAEQAAETLGEQVERAHGDVRDAEARLSEQQAQLERERAVRAEAVEALRRLTAAGVVAAAVPDVELPNPDEPWAPDPTVRLARRELGPALEQVDASDEAWERVSGAISHALTDLQRALSAQGSTAEGDLRHDVLVVTVRYQQRTTTPHALADALDDDIAWRRELLDAKEREILENHLVNDVASHLSRLIADADATVKRMNAELMARPTSTGMVLQLRWRPDLERGPAGLREARSRLLQQMSVMWSLEDREALGRFLKTEIDRVRAEDETATWFEQLSRAFDYRRWHHFVVERRQGDGSWRRASGPASGGERVLAATVPLFAAASAHYASADPHAPRLVLLDEAFAGVDDAARRQCMSLLATFDLDCMLTSEREWGCYPEVPGLSICHLVRFDGIDAVHVSRWEWDGRVRSEIDHPRDGAIAAQPDAAAADSLFTAPAAD